MSRVKVNLSKDVDKLLGDLVESYFQDGGTIDIDCPHCGVSVTVHAGENTCPSCKNLIFVNDKINL